MLKHTHSLSANMTEIHERYYTAEYRRHRVEFAVWCLLFAVGLKTGTQKLIRKINIADAF